MKQADPQSVAVAAKYPGTAPRARVDRPGNCQASTVGARQGEDKSWGGISDYPHLWDKRAKLSHTRDR